YMNKTVHMWEDNEKLLLEELVSPVPELFRDVAKHKIASKIGEIALQKKKDIITQEILIEGYIIATRKREHKLLRKKLHQKNIDVTPYEQFFHQSRDDYAKGWLERHDNSKYRTRLTLPVWRVFYLCIRIRMPYFLFKLLKF